MDSTFNLPFRLTVTEILDAWKWLVHFTNLALWQVLVIIRSCQKNTAKLNTGVYKLSLRQRTLQVLISDSAVLAVFSCSFILILLFGEALILTGWQGLVDSLISTNVMTEGWKGSHWLMTIDLNCGTYRKHNKYINNPVWILCWTRADFIFSGGWGQDLKCARTSCSEHLVMMGVSATGLWSLRQVGLEYFGIGMMQVVLKQVGTTECTNYRLEKSFRTSTSSPSTRSDSHQGYHQHQQLFVCWSSSVLWPCWRVSAVCSALVLGCPSYNEHRCC